MRVTPRVQGPVVRQDRPVRPAHIQEGELMNDRLCRRAHWLASVSLVCAAPLLAVPSSAMADYIAGIHVVPSASAVATSVTGHVFHDLSRDGVRLGSIRAECRIVR